MGNKKDTGDFYRNIIKILEQRLENLELDRMKYNRFVRFVKGIDKNIKKTRVSIDYYNNVLHRYIKAGWVE